MLPWLQLGEQLGAWQVPFLQTWEPQSVVAPQAVPVLQWGAQLGALQTPSTQERVVQKLLLVPHAVPLGHEELAPQFVEQLDPEYPTAHLHVPALHVPWPAHVGPPGQVTEQSGPE